MRMRKFSFSLLVSLSTVCLLTGCATDKITLFSGAPSGNGTYSLPDAPAFIIEPGDAMVIAFYGSDRETVSPFNMRDTNYVVAPDGCVTLPVLGKKRIAGMQEARAEQELQTAAANHLRNPMVRVHIRNARITVLGEVARPGTFSIDKPVTLLAALGMAGDMRPNAKRDNVLIQRQENGRITQYRVNLLTDELFASPCYYLQKGDVVYVSPRYKSRRR